MSVYRTIGPLVIKYHQISTLSLLLIYIYMYVFSDLFRMEVGQVRLLTLNIGESLQEKLFRLEKGMYSIGSIQCIYNVLSIRP